MLDKIIQKIKNLIPKKDKGEPQKDKVEPQKDESPPATAPSEQPLTEDEAKKKKKSMMIKIGVGVLLLYFVADEMLKEPAPEPSLPTAASPRKKDAPRKPKKTLEDHAKEDTKKPAQTPAAQTPSPAAEKVSRDLSSEAPKEEAPVVETPTPEEATPEAPTPEESAPEEMALEEAPAPEADSAEVSTEQPETSETVTSPTEEIAQDMEKISEEVGTVAEGEEIQPAENVPLPDYSIRGRGLVYNCKDKHWACIDKEGYFSCRSHMNWSKENNKPADCAIKNVYATDDDCSVIQLHYINTNEPTDFCNNN